MLLALIRWTQTQPKVCSGTGVLKCTRAAGMASKIFEHTVLAWLPTPGHPPDPGTEITPPRYLEVPESQSGNSVSVVVLVIPFAAGLDVDRSFRGGREVIAHRGRAR